MLLLLHAQIVPKFAASHFNFKQYYKKSRSNVHGNHLVKIVYMEVVELYYKYLVS
jgi:hypothetical protein